MIDRAELLTSMVPEGHVVVDDGYYDAEWFTSTSGYIVPAELWTEWNRLNDLRLGVEEQMRACQRGRQHLVESSNFQP
jgi:hypothetical protein